MVAGPSKTVSVPQLAWWGDIVADLHFPSGWQIETCTCHGSESPPLDVDGLRRALAQPIGTKPLRELARGKRSVVIVFDDLSRPTKVDGIVPFVLEELAAGGVEEDSVQFICALGCHGALTAFDFRKKLGADIVARFNVYNHNPYDNCAYVGKTTRQTPVALNAEFLGADLKIGIGSIVPHPAAGFGGGAKIVVPGVAAMETIVHNHKLWRPPKSNDLATQFRMGETDGNAMLADMHEICRMSGLDFKIDALVNLKRETVRLFAGDPIEEYSEGVVAARQHYLSPRPQSPDVIVVNCNAKANEALVGSSLAQMLLPEQGGTIVVVANNPYGEVPHYLSRRFGDHMGGPFWRKPALPAKVRQFILLMPYRDKASADWLAPLERISWAATWEEVLAMLEAQYPAGARVAVIPDGTIQLF